MENSKNKTHENSAQRRTFFSVHFSSSRVAHFPKVLLDWRNGSEVKTTEVFFQRFRVQFPVLKRAHKYLKPKYVDI